MRARCNSFATVVVACGGYRWTVRPRSPTHLRHWRLPENAGGRLVAKECTTAGPYPSLIAAGCVPHSEVLRLPRIYPCGRFSVCEMLLPCKPRAYPYG